MNNITFTGTLQNLFFKLYPNSSNQDCWEFFSDSLDIFDYYIDQFDNGIPVNELERVCLLIFKEVCERKSIEYIHEDNTQEYINEDNTLEYSHEDNTQEYINEDNTLEYSHEDNTQEYINEDNTLEYIHEDNTQEYINEDLYLGYDTY